MSRWLTSVPSSQVSYFAACELVYRRLTGPGAATAAVGEHFAILSGYAFKSADYVSNGVRLLRNVNVKPHRIDWTDSVCIASSAAEAFERFALHAGDLVMSMDGTINKQGLKVAFLSPHDVPALLLQRVCRFDPVGAVTTTFLYHMFHAADFFDYLDKSNRSIAIPHVSAQQLKAFRIPVPSIDVQEAICTFLSSVEQGHQGQGRLPLPYPLSRLPLVVERIAAIAGRIEEARRAEGEVQDALNVFIAGSSEQVLRELSREHKTCYLEETCLSITDGDHNTPTFFEVGVSFIFVGNVSSAHLHFDGAKKVSPEYFGNLQAKRVPTRGDILYSAVGATLGVPAIVDTDEAFCFQRHIAILKLDCSQMSPEFVWYMLQATSVVSAAWAATTGSAQPTIPLRSIRKLRLPVPPLEVQLTAVTHLERLRSFISELETLRSGASTELATFLPAVLDEALRGEL